MLILNENKIAIVVKSWSAGDRAAHYAIVPYDADGHRYVEVEALTDGDFEILEPESSSWSELEDGSHGYPETKSLDRELYYVWDEGAAAHPQAATKLYEGFSSLIEQYKPAANKYLNENSERLYEDRVKEAKDRGWDVNVIEKEASHFPYDPKN